MALKGLVQVLMALKGFSPNLYPYFTVAGAGLQGRHRHLHVGVLVAANYERAPHYLLPLPATVTNSATESKGERASPPTRSALLQSAAHGSNPKLKQQQKVPQPAPNYEFRLLPRTTNVPPLKTQEQSLGPEMFSSNVPPRTREDCWRKFGTEQLLLLGPGI